MTLLGLTGSGKTTTAERLAEGAVASGVGLLVIDAKGAGLRAAARRLAAARGIDHREVVPGAPGTLGYNPCAVGSRAQVADKLVSAFTHGPAGQVYRVIALETISILVGLLRGLGEPVTIRRLRRELDRTRMPGLAHRARDLTPDLADDLAELSRRGGVSADAFEGMRPASALSSTASTAASSTATGHSSTSPPPSPPRGSPTSACRRWR